MRLLAIIWGIFQMVILSVLCVIGITIYYIFGFFGKGLNKWDLLLWATYKTKVLDGKIHTNAHAMIYYIPHILLQILVTITWCITTPAYKFKNITMKAIERLS